MSRRALCFEGTSLSRDKLDPEQVPCDRREQLYGGAPGGHADVVRDTPSLQPGRGAGPVDRDTPARRPHRISSSLRRCTPGTPRPSFGPGANLAESWSWHTRAWARGTRGCSGTRRSSRSPASTPGRPHRSVSLYRSRSVRTLGLICPCLRQVLLRWALQLGCPVLPKSTQPGRLEEYRPVTLLEGWALDEGDLQLIAAMEDGHKYAWDPERVS